MKVRDLIEKLQKLPPDAYVVKSHYSDNEYHYPGQEILIRLEDMELFSSYILYETMECTPVEFTKEKRYSIDKKSDVVILKF